jgi:6-phosphofructokinase
LTSIFRLIVCGGDGSLTGASTLYSEWDEHLKAIVEEDKKKNVADIKNGDVIFSEEILHHYPALKIVGFVGSIGMDIFNF